MSRNVDTAIVLAAGRGTRLKSSWPDLPKGFVEIAGERLIERSTRLLRENGVRRIVIVAGHKADAYYELSAQHPDIEIVENPEFATTESMASLAYALDLVKEDFLLLESDLFYESRALEVLQNHECDDVVLTSAATGATDEVWVDAKQGRLRNLTKNRDEAPSDASEFVGILRISADLAGQMRALYGAFVLENGHGRMAYETGALLAAARKRAVEICLVPDLLWGEVDYDSHYERLLNEVIPALRTR
jgi:choline kinase